MSQEVETSEKSFFGTLVLGIMVGQFGIHRFYVGKTKTGILMLLTLGCFGLWQLVDVIVIAFQKFKDNKGLPIKP